MLEPIKDSTLPQENQKNARTALVLMTGIEKMSLHTHTHVDENGNMITHTHEIRNASSDNVSDGPGDTGTETVPAHGHYHDPAEKKKQLNRIARAIGHLQHVKTMMENDEDCAEVLIQLSAVNSALKNLGKEIINEHMTHCIYHAIEDGDTQAVEEFQKAVTKFM